MDVFIFRVKNTWSYVIASVACDHAVATGAGEPSLSFEASAADGTHSITTFSHPARAYSTVLSKTSPPPALFLTAC